MDAEIDIAHGIVDVHVTFNGEDVADAPVYLFTASGSYLGRYEYTDIYGHASFFVPAQSYKFRVDYESTQYWSDVVYVIAHEETDVEMPLELLALNKTNDPNPVRYDGKPPKFEPEEIKVASIGSLAGILSQTVVANTAPPKVYYYLNDHLGTPQLMTDENNVVVWEAKYKPFGEAVVHPYSTVENNVRLPGQYFDQETGLHYNYHRYYDPRTGRYLRADPIGLAADLNLFIYAGNNPINAIDLIGLDYLVFNGKNLMWVFEKRKTIFGIPMPWQEEVGRETWKASSGKTIKDLVIYEHIPEGTYWTSPCEKEYHSGNEVAWGPFSYRLHESLLTALSNRIAGHEGGFHIHGGFLYGTAGCIEFADYSKKQKSLRKFDLRMKSYGKKIKLYVRY